MTSNLMGYTPSNKIGGYYSGPCEYCATYSSDLNLTKITDLSSLTTTNRERNFYSNPFWCCHHCRRMLSRIDVTYVGHKHMIKEEQIDNKLLKSGHIKNTLARKIKSLEDIFPEEIDGVFIIPPSELPGRYKEKMNILVSFKSLSLLNYFRFVLDRDHVCLMHTWKDCAKDKLKTRAQFWRAKDTRILLALGRIHCQSDILRIWVWADTRMLSIEFFCKAPVNMLQISPKKILRLT